MKTLADEVVVISHPDRHPHRSRIELLFEEEQIPLRFVNCTRVATEAITSDEVSEVAWMPFKVLAGWNSYLRGAVECKRAHLECLRQAAASEANSLLIFEDDVAFRHGWCDRLAAAVSELPHDWLQLYLSAQPFRETARFSANLGRLSGAYQTTAIMYSRAGIEAAVSCVSRARAEVDYWMGLHLHPFGCSYLVEPQVTFALDGAAGGAGGPVLT